MPTTTYTDMAAAALALQARTDAAGAPVTDTNGEELRLAMGFLSPGVIQSVDYKTVPGSGLSVDVGTLTKKDLAVVAGTVAGQGNYLVRIGASVPYNITLNAADPSNPRIDQIYIVVEDIAYDSGTRTMARLSRRTGDPLASPVAPGPDAAWKAFLLIAQIAVAAGATSLSVGNITDSRIPSTSILPSRSIPGIIQMFGGVTAPAGSLFCDGSAISRATYADLFAAIGTAYGVGDGSTTFNIPDLRQRFPLGKATSGTGSTLGGTGGVIDHVHTGPSHTHTGPSHIHTMPTHTHTGPSHTHTGPSHTHSTPAHQHPMQSHTHSFSDTSSGGAAGLSTDTGIGVSTSPAGHTHVVSGTTGSTASLTDGGGNGTSGSGGTGATGSGGTGTTGATDPGDTAAGGTAATGSGGTANTGAANAPFQVVNYIVWT